MEVVVVVGRAKRQRQESGAVREHGAFSMLLLIIPWDRAGNALAQVVRAHPLKRARQWAFGASASEVVFRGLSVAIGRPPRAARLAWFHLGGRDQPETTVAEHLA